MDALIAFLRARLDEEQTEGGCGGVGEYGACDDLSERSLRAVAAHRAILELADDIMSDEVQLEGEFGVGPRTWPYNAELLLKHLASVYADHEEYREQWKP